MLPWARVVFAVLAAAALAGAGCSASDGDGRGRGDGGGGGDAGGGMDDGGGGGTDGDIPVRDADLDECGAAVVEAEESFAPVDIVWVIDNSGSMSGEAEIVQNNMNDFAATIGDSGIDYRVVVMTMEGFVSVPPPLGTDDERFLFVDQSVASNHALLELVNNYDRYADFLRRRSILHFVGVTDDESEEMDHMTFKSMMEGMLGKTFRFHTIASPPGSEHCMVGFCGMPGCSGPNGAAAENGDEYWALAELTGGVKFSICTEDWSSLFDTLSSSIAVPTALPCAFDVPEPPADMELDPMRVNVVYTPGDGSGERVIPYAEEESRCMGDGWYYDDPADPSRILMCPGTCTRLEGDASGSVEIALGCETILI